MSRFHNRNFELLEPYDAKVSRTVLRGEGSSNAPDLLDLFLDNSDENLRQFERTARNMQSLAQYSRSNQINKEWIDDWARVLNSDVRNGSMSLSGFYASKEYLSTQAVLDTYTAK